MYLVSGLITAYKYMTPTAVFYQVYLTYLLYYVYQGWICNHSTRTICVRKYYIWIIVLYRWLNVTSFYSSLLCFVKFKVIIRIVTKVYKSNSKDVKWMLEHELEHIIRIKCQRSNLWKNIPSIYNYVIFCNFYRKIDQLKFLLC